MRCRRLLLNHSVECSRGDQSSIVDANPRSTTQASSSLAEAPARPNPHRPQTAHQAPAGSFLEGRRQAVTVEGRTAATESRGTGNRYERLPALAADLVGGKVDLIAALGNAVTLAAKSTTSTIPVVFAIGTDPVELGLVASLARPGGNLRLAWGAGAAAPPPPPRPTPWGCPPPPPPPRPPPRPPSPPAP